MATTMDDMSRYLAPVNPKVRGACARAHTRAQVYPHLTVTLLTIGLFFTAWFLVYEVTSTKYTRNLAKELMVATVAAVFMGFGTLFLLLWVGIFV